MTYSEFTNILTESTGSLVSEDLPKPKIESNSGVATPFDWAKNLLSKFKFPFKSVENVYTTIKNKFPEISSKALEISRNMDVSSVITLVTDPQKFIDELTSSINVTDIPNLAASDLLDQAKSFVMSASSELGIAAIPSTLFDEAEKEVDKDVDEPFDDEQFLLDV